MVFARSKPKLHWQKWEICVIHGLRQLSRLYIQELIFRNLYEPTKKLGVNVPKRYFSTNAVHMEITSDLTMDTFIGALKHFIRRRGHCKNLYSENYVRARNQVIELKKAAYSEKALNRISWTCTYKGITLHTMLPSLSAASLTTNNRRRFIYKENDG